VLNVNTLIPVRITFDPAKNARNIRLRGLSFERVVEIDLGAALIAVDERRDYGEVRYVALCHLEGRLHVLCFRATKDALRVISFRKANAREVRRYEQATAADESKR
jgi:uncharacterized DUF497 family protein